MAPQDVTLTSVGGQRAGLDLAALRHAAGLTLEEIAGATGIGLRYIEVSKLKILSSCRAVFTRPAISASTLGKSAPTRRPCCSDTALKSLSLNRRPPLAGKPPRCGGDSMMRCGIFSIMLLIEAEGRTRPSLGRATNLLVVDRPNNHLHLQRRLHACTSC